VAVEAEWIRGALSYARFGPYLARVDEDTSAALRLYWWNVEVSAAFYPVLHMLEVSVRNALHARLTEMLQRSDWWEVAPLQDNGIRLVTDAKVKISQRKQVVSTDDVVAELTFGFWVSLVSRKHDQELWVRGLHRAFPYYRGSRSELHRPLRTIMLLRNRIMHYEPIHHRHLEADHSTILRMLGYLSPELVRCIKSQDHVPAVLHRREPIRRSAIRP